MTPDKQLTEYFKLSEFACRCGCGFNRIDISLVLLLDTLRRRLGFPIEIVSGCRCEKHNAAVGGSRISAHLNGLAADIMVRTPRERFLILQAIFIEELFYRIEDAPTWIHVDIDQSKTQRVIFLKRGPENA